MEGTAVAVCEILKYLIIHWKCETAGVPKGALVEGQLVISIEALNSKHRTNTLHCVTTIASTGSIYDGLILKKFLKEIQSMLHGFSAKLNWTSEEASYFQDTSRVSNVQMICEVDEKPRTLMTDSLVIKNFLHKISIVQPKIKFNFSVKMNGISSIEMFGVQNEPTLSLWNGIALVVNSQHYVRFLYGPSGLPLVLPTQEQPATAVFKDTSYFINWKKHHLCMVPNLDLNLDRGVHSWLAAHLSAVLVESHSAVQASLQGAVDQALEQHQQAAQICQKLQASLSVAVNSIMSIVTSSTSSSFRKTCLQALQAADTQDFGTKLHEAFHEVTRHQFLHHCSYEARQHLPPENAAQSAEDARDNSCPDLGTSGIRRPVGKRRLKRNRVRRRVAETPASPAAGASGPPRPSRAARGPPAGPRSPGGSGAGPGRGLEDALWLQEVSNLSEWLRPGPAL